jgi:hypothetical protein
MRPPPAPARFCLGGLAGGLLIGIGIYVAPEVSDYLSRRRERAEAARSALSASLLAR